jgi:hypothetical protein
MNCSFFLDVVGKMKMIVVAWSGTPTVQSVGSHYSGHLAIFTRLM